VNTNRTNSTNGTPAYRVGEPTIDLQYPIYGGPGLDILIAVALRWGRDWILITSRGEVIVGRPDKGVPGIEKAATRAAEEYAAGTITALPPLAEAPELIVPTGDVPVPLLHPRVPETPRNIQAAKDADATMAKYFWLRLSGFPGSDNLMTARCMLCGWVGLRYYSHLRGRNNTPPSITRHPGGCVGADKIRQLIPGYTK
jgi:hypothetical protein